MTPAELRSIDAQVAERVMGWKPVAHPRPDSNECLIYSKGETFRVLKTSSGGNVLSPFQPTESDADAMAVLRKCNEHINEFKYREVIGISTIAGDPLITYRPKAIAECAKTLPLAISLFALKLWE